MTRSSKVAALAIVTVLVLIAAPRSGPETTTEARSSVPADKAAPSFGLGDTQGQSGASHQMSGTVSPSSSGAPQPTGMIDAGGASYFKPTPRVVVSKGTGDTLRGSATWYAWHPGEAAAGPGLRAWLGADWRGKVVTVIAPGCTCRPVAVRLTDWCLCGGGRIIDLDRRSFAALIDPSFGVISVIVMEGTTVTQATPRTAAGRFLLNGILFDGGHLYGSTREAMTEYILAIEAEAARQVTELRARIAELEDGMDEIRHHFLNDNIRPGTAAFRMVAVAERLSAGDKAEAPTHIDDGLHPGRLTLSTYPSAGDKAEAPRHE